MQTVEFNWKPVIYSGRQNKNSENAEGNGCHKINHIKNNTDWV